MRIKYYPSDMDAPGCYRCLFPGRQLSLKGGHTVLLPRRVEHEREDGRMIVEMDADVDFKEADIYVLQQRKERMWAEGLVQRLRQLGVATVADVDDNYLELPEYNPAFYGTHPYRRNDGVIVNRAARRRVAKRVGQKIGSNKSNRDLMHDSFSQVDLLTVSTPYLASIYAKYNPKIEVIRNYLDWDIWKGIKPQYKVYRKRTRIGYLGTFNYRQGDLDVIKDVIPKFMKQHPQVDFVANSEATLDYLGVPQGQRINIGEYSFRPRDDKPYPVGRMTARLDIGLVPLAMNGLNEGKSHLKGMEYNAAGIPFVASPTESYKDYWCEHGYNGFLAERAGDWEWYLNMLVMDESGRRWMGESGRRKASEHTIQKNWWRWEHIYSDLLGDEYDQLARRSVAMGAVQKISEMGSLLRTCSERIGRPKVVVEIGSARGGTFWGLARVADPEALMVSIDIPSGSAMDVRGGQDVYARAIDYRERFKSLVAPSQKVVLIDANSQLDSTLDRLRQTLHGRQVDLLFIDADHHYEGVMRDYQLYSPLVREGGLVCFHDIIHHKDKRVGVDRAWDEIKQGKTYYEFFGEETWGFQPWGGIGVLVA